MAFENSARNGQFYQSNFPDNTGGTNLADSVFKIQPTQAAGGFNFDYILTGGIRKRLGPAPINSVAFSTLYSHGFGLYSTAAGSKSVIRAADRALELFDTDVPSVTALLGDTASASLTPFAANSTVPVRTSMFNNGTSNILWCTGAGATLPVGAVSTTQWTMNGSAAPVGAITTTVNTSAGGTFAAAGTYYYAVLYRKRSTQGNSNLTLDQIAVTVNMDDTVTIDLTGLTGLDTTYVDQIWIYRSALNGVTAFTTGDLIAQLASTATTYTDTGTSILSSVNVPRVGSLILDNSTLPAGTYVPMTLFKRRLVTAQNSTLYFSDLNKSESWPTVNTITVPSGGNITALAIVSFTSPQANSLDELLVVFKEREMWVVTGTDYTDWALKYIDQVGCPQQGLCVTANGFLGWIDFRGIYLWDGSSKPIYCSRLLEPLFARDGDLDKTKFNVATSEFFRRENQIIWYLSSKVFGEQKFAIKMDMRLTLPQIEQTLTGRNIDAVLIQDHFKFPIYASLSYIPSGGSQEQLVLGDNAGKTYFASNGFGDGTSDFEFTYKTPPLCMGDPNTKKQFHQVVVWVQDLGNWNLELDYWSEYKTAPMYQSTKVQPISTENQTSSAIWDVALWDVAYWDTFNSNVVPIVFNLDSGQSNSNQGSAIQLQFRNAIAGQPITIHGWSVVWSPLGGITA